jgi:hypothetical protein
MLKNLENFVSRKTNFFWEKYVFCEGKWSICLEYCGVLYLLNLQKLIIIIIVQRNW